MIGTKYSRSDGEKFAAVLFDELELLELLELEDDEADADEEDAPFFHTVSTPSKNPGFR